MNKSKRKVPEKELCAFPGKQLNKIAQQALEEAALRRRESDQASEISGDCPSGSPEPTRYGDWQNKGRCSDF